MARLAEDKARDEKALDDLQQRWVSEEDWSDCNEVIEEQGVVEGKGKGKEEEEEGESVDKEWNWDLKHGWF